MLLRDSGAGDVRLPLADIRTAWLVLTDALIKAVQDGKALHGITADDVVYNEPLSDPHGDA